MRTLKCLVRIGTPFEEFNSEQTMVVECKQLAAENAMEWIDLAMKKFNCTIIRGERIINPHLGQISGIEFDLFFSYLAAAINKLMYSYFVDCREPKELQEALKDYTCAALTVGDFQMIELTDVGQRLAAVIERKTWADLAASIRDGRAKEQLARMIEVAAAQRCEVFYIIEGKYNKKTCGLSFKNLIKALTNKITRDRIHVLPSGNLTETAETVRAICASVAEFSPRLIGGQMIPEQNETKLPETSSSRPSRYTETRKVTKASKSLENAPNLMLMNIPGLSAATADALVAHYGTIFTLCESLSTGNTTELENIMVQGRNKVRRIGPTLAAKIRDSLIGSAK